MALLMSTPGPTANASDLKPGGNGVGTTRSQGVLVTLLVEGGAVGVGLLGIDGVAGEDAVGNPRHRQMRILDPLDAPLALGAATVREPDAGDSAPCDFVEVELADQRAVHGKGG